MLAKIASHMQTCTCVCDLKSQGGGTEKVQKIVDSQDLVENGLLTVCRQLFDFSVSRVFMELV